MISQNIEAKLWINQIRFWYYLYLYLSPARLQILATASDNAQTPSTQLLYQFKNPMSTCPTVISRAQIHGLHL